MMGKRAIGWRPSGMTIIYVIILWCVLIGLASWAVDFGTLQVVQSQLKAAVDAAALAASGGLAVSPAEARSRAKEIASLNTVNGKPFVLLDSDIEMGSWNATTRQFTVVTGSAESTANGVRVNGYLAASRNSAVNLTFLSLLSPNHTMNLQASAVGAAAIDSADIVLVQDVSYSFSGEIATAKTGDQDLLNSLNVAGSKSTFGIVAFTGTATTVKPLATINTNYSSLSGGISSLSVGGAGMPSVYGGTDIAAGIEKAQSVFSAQGTSHNARSIVIVSDGEPTPSTSGEHSWCTSSSQLLSIAQGDADAAWAAGINVYVVFWNSTNDATASANLKSLIRGKGVFVNVTDPADLPAAIGLILKNQGRIVK